MDNNTEQQYDIVKQYKANLDNMKEFLSQPSDDIDQGTIDDPSLAAWEASVKLFEGALIMSKIGLKLKQEIISKGLTIMEEKESNNGQANTTTN